MGQSEAVVEFARCFADEASASRFDRALADAVAAYRDVLERGDFSLFVLREHSGAGHVRRVSCECAELLDQIEQAL